MKTEEQCLRDYLGPDLEASTVLRDYAAWCVHGGGGERFLDIHCQLVSAFDQFRATRRMRPILPWDPSTKIPGWLAHDAILHHARETDDPSSNDARCKTPTWATVVGAAPGGASDPDPLFGYAKLGQFRSADELGRSISYQWYNVVHMTIGGDMATFEAPVDPVCWAWFGWIRHTRLLWERARAQAALAEAGSGISARDPQHSRT